MSWQITGTFWGPCSCKVSCPCELGESEGDNVWCSGTLAFEVRNGNAEGVDLSGAKVVADVDFPGGMLGGGGTGRLYFDPAVSGQQRSGLEAVLKGQRGGVFEVLSSLITNWLPTKDALINIQKGQEETRIAVGEYGELISRPLRGATGEPTKLLHGAAAFREEIILARGTGSWWRDPDMRAWESGGHSERAEFDWSG